MSAQPALLVGMDTPQLTPELLLDGIRALALDGVDAVLGPALDGGYWSIGLREPRRRSVFAGVPMSVPGTCCGAAAARSAGSGCACTSSRRCSTSTRSPTARIVARAGAAVAVRGGAGRRTPSQDGAARRDPAHPLASLLRRSASASAAAARRLPA